MSENEFIPMSAQLGVTGSSYLLQMGLVNEKWSIRLVKGQSILDSKVFEEKMPNANILTGWVLSALVLPNINTYQIQKTVGFIRQKAIRNYQDRQAAKQTAGKEERKSVELEKVPEKKLKRIVSKSVVKDAEESDSGIKVDAAEVSPSLAASNRAAMESQAISKPAAKVKSKGAQEAQEAIRPTDFSRRSV